MDLIELTGARAVYADIAATSKKALFQEMSERIGSAFDLDSRALFQAFLEREKLGSTGMGAGVAIPHCRLENISRIRGALARLSSPIDFDAVDGEPVDLFFFLIGPENNGAEHLRALARVSRALRDPAVLSRLRGAENDDALQAALSEADSLRAA